MGCRMLPLSRTVRACSLSSTYCLSSFSSPAGSLSVLSSYNVTCRPRHPRRPFIHPGFFLSGTELQQLRLTLEHNGCFSEGIIVENSDRDELHA
ncbi:hypothetical protein LEMLEM_LOCUS3962 [Lemmus lemmus]